MGFRLNVKAHVFVPLAGDHPQGPGRELRGQAQGGHQQTVRSSQRGEQKHGFDIESEAAEIKDCLESNILDLMIAKKWALKYATNAAATVLRVDQIIMAKRAGGPKPRDTTSGMDQD